ncbi:kinase-like protein [Pseudovirgaria hyperparasitica]|uniref:Kinase-like protein n=1 Tax=Pseudovirgaria hyperparasitica TaxID=470096 RepID=A0A6A6W2Z0_9PEZI|nr:kinase-like protein [Pseudovirgaria hyperparasitica]KAF2756356.1 kinase-like protein [Pseudovirgaria hyperparasitica]
MGSNRSYLSTCLLRVLTCNIRFPNHAPNISSHKSLDKPPHEPSNEPSNTPSNETRLSKEPINEPSPFEEISNEPGVDSIPPGALHFIAGGKAGIIFTIDEKRVLKEFHSPEDGNGEVEREAYQRLGSHPNITKLLCIRADGSIVLERGTALRTLCQSATEIALVTKIDWLIDAAKGYQYLHECGIIHCDVGCNNLISTMEGVKLIDFEGCSIDGRPGDSCYEWFSYRPATPYTSRATDIFAFGCTIYEIVTGRPPYHEHQSRIDAGPYVEKLYTACEFPDTTGLPLNHVMQSCWRGRFGCMSQIVRDLEHSKSLIERSA